MSMRMDACSKEKQIGTLFVRVGALEGGLKGGGSEILDPPSKNLLGHSYKILNISS
jgi:hypothetical protein